MASPYIPHSPKVDLLLASSSSPGNMNITTSNLRGGNGIVFDHHQQQHYLYQNSTSAEQQHLQLLQQQQYHHHHHHQMLNSPYRTKSVYSSSSPAPPQHNSSFLRPAQTVFPSQTFATPHNAETPSSSSCTPKRQASWASPRRKSCSFAPSHPRHQSGSSPSYTQPNLSSPSSSLPLTLSFSKLSTTPRDLMAEESKAYAKLQSDRLSSSSTTANLQLQFESMDMDVDDSNQIDTDNNEHERIHQHQQIHDCLPGGMVGDASVASKSSRPARLDNNSFVPTSPIAHSNQRPSLFQQPSFIAPSPAPKKTHISVSAPTSSSFKSPYLQDENGFAIPTLPASHLSSASRRRSSSLSSDDAVFLAPPAISISRVGRSGSFSSSVPSSASKYSSSSSSTSFYTPQAASKVAKPNLQVFTSTGLQSKKSRSRPASIQPTPGTPSKKVAQSVAMSCMTPAPLSHAGSSRSSSSSSISSMYYSANGSSPSIRLALGTPRKHKIRSPLTKTPGMNSSSSVNGSSSNSMLSASKRRQLFYKPQQPFQSSPLRSSSPSLNSAIKRHGTHRGDVNNDHHHFQHPSSGGKAASLVTLHRNSSTPLVPYDIAASPTPFRKHQTSSPSSKLATSSFFSLSPSANRHHHHNGNGPSMPSTPLSRKKFMAAAMQPSPIGNSKTTNTFIPNHNPSSPSFNINTTTNQSQTVRRKSLDKGNSGSPSPHSGSVLTASSAKKKNLFLSALNNHLNQSHHQQGSLFGNSTSLTNLPNINTPVPASLLTFPTSSSPSPCSASSSPSSCASLLTPRPPGLLDFRENTRNVNMDTDTEDEPAVDYGEMMSEATEMIRINSHPHSNTNKEDKSDTAHDHQQHSGTEEEEEGLDSPTAVLKMRGLNRVAYAELITSWPRFLSLSYLESLRRDEYVHIEPPASENPGDYFELNFTVLEQLGKGSFANAFKVQSKSDGKWYAVKKTRIPYTGFKDRLRILEEVYHHFLITPTPTSPVPNIVHLVAAWEQYGYLYMQTELCPRGSLYDYFETHCATKAIPEERVWGILAQLCLGVRAMHDREMVHLDLKPANVFVGENWGLKIGDFGMASQLPIRKNAEKEGDRNYIAPEILEEVYGKPADIFSLGLIVLEMTANIILPDFGPAWQKLRSHDFSDVEFPSDTNPLLLDCISKMLHPDPNLRPTIHELIGEVGGNNQSTTSDDAGQSFTDLLKQVVYEIGQGVPHGLAYPVNEDEDDEEEVIGEESYQTEDLQQGDNIGAEMEESRQQDDASMAMSTSNSAASSCTPSRSHSPHSHMMEEREETGRVYETLGGMVG